MTDQTNVPTERRLYNMTGQNCPRCNQPTKVVTTATATRVLLIRCICCAYQIDVDGILKHVKSLVAVNNPEEATSPEEPIE